MNTVSIIIPNWNGRKLLEKHLPSVILAAKKSEILIVDDASTDDSIEFIRSTHPQITIVAIDKRKGFSGTVNAGVKYAKGDIVVLLNTDVEPKANFLAPLLQVFADKNVFAAGCLEESTEDGQLVLRGRGVAEWKNGFFIHSRGDTQEPTTAWVSGGSGAFRKAMWQELGGLDELYSPFYWEDIDISYRALKAGYSLRFVKTSVVIHRHEIGKIFSEYSRLKIKSIAYRNQLIFIWKNASSRTLWKEHIYQLPLFALKAMIRADVAFIVGFLQAMLRLPKILISRQIASKHWKHTDESISLK